jgi:hypothetical protein
MSDLVDINRGASTSSTGTPGHSTGPARTEYVSEKQARFAFEMMQEMRRRDELCDVALVVMQVR